MLATTQQNPLSTSQQNPLGLLDKGNNSVLDTMADDGYANGAWTPGIKDKVSSYFSFSTLQWLGFLLMQFVVAKTNADDDSENFSTPMTVLHGNVTPTSATANGVETPTTLNESEPNASLQTMNTLENAAASTPHPSTVTKPRGIIDMMENQKKLHKNLELIKQHGLNLPKEINLEECIDGFHLVTGVQSSGKSATISRIVGSEVLVSSPKLGTR